MIFSLLQNTGGGVRTFYASEPASDPLRLDMSSPCSKYYSTIHGLDGES